MAWGGDWQLSDQSTGVGRIAFFKLCDSSRIGLVSQFVQAPFDKSSRNKVNIQPHCQRG